MASLQVRDLPVQLYEKLKKKAKDKHRSLAQQAVITLTKGLEASPDPKSIRTNILDSLSSDNRINKQYNISDPVAMIREDRER